eukprot:1160079-Pelagomonas_calceolata.AAC.10
MEMYITPHWIWWIGWKRCLYVIGCMPLDWLETPFVCHWMYAIGLAGNGACMSLDPISGHGSPLLIYSLGHMASTQF